jgi:hypothetical protein
MDGSFYLGGFLVRCSPFRKGSLLFRASTPPRSGLVAGIEKNFTCAAIDVGVRIDTTKMCVRCQSLLALSCAGDPVGRLLHARARDSEVLAHQVDRNRE